MTLRGLVLDHLLPLAVREPARKRIEVSHVVCFKFKGGVSRQEIEQVAIDFRRMAKRTSLVRSIKYGRNNSPEKLNNGLTHCFVLTFKSTRERDQYLVHREHQEFSRSIEPLLADVFVIDFIDRIL
jgi:hypothetical protein